MYLQIDYWIFIYLLVLQSFYLIIHQYFFKESNSFDSIETK
jgi:hypothetical protein